MTLGTLSAAECELVRQWRNSPDVLPMLRTREPLTVAQQAAFYRDVVCNTRSNHRYYALYDEHRFVGMGGLTYLDREPGEAEISLILGPQFRGSGLGTQAVQALRAEAARLGLRMVVGECYQQNPAREFWVKTVERCGGTMRPIEGGLLFALRAA